MECNISATMNIQLRVILPIASLAFALAIWFPNNVSADELKEAKVTQVIQDVKVLPSNESPRPAVVNDNVHQGTAVQTGGQSRSELTFKDQTITRLGEKTIFSVGEGARTIDLGSGQVLLYVPKKSGGAKVKMGPVTAVGQCLLVVAGQKVTYDPIAMRLEDPVEVDLQQQQTSPLITGFRPLPSTPYINSAIEKQRRAAAGTGGAELARAVSASGAVSIGAATPEQFLAAFSSLLVRYPQAEICDFVATAVRLRPELADRIVVAAVTGSRPVRGYSKEAKDFKEKEMPCEWVQCIVDAAIAGNPRMANEIINALLQAAPMLRECIGEPCFPANQFRPPLVISPLTPQVNSPEKPPK